MMPQAVLPDNMDMHILFFRTRHSYTDLKKMTNTRGDLYKK
jgi:hypothetical protein